MSEYWKSTPKYWCKHCKTYVRDTPYERTQHEATGKHQGSLKRFLRDVHRSQDADQKQSQRAKNEVDRLKGLVASSLGTGTPEKPAPWKRSSVGASGTSASASVNKEQRKKQMEQLAGMGVAIPEEYRPEMAMVGEWTTVSEAPVSDSIGANSVLVKGVKRRKVDGEEEDDEENLGRSGSERARPRKAWGSTFKSHTGTGEDDDGELDALLSMTTQIGNKRTRVKPEPQDSPVKQEEIREADESVSMPEDATVKIKQEDDSEHIVPKGGTPDISAGPPAEFVGEPTPTVIFKKRKPKQNKK
ncbi:hypothetical protein LOZ12_003579 [Ophidiomyces ophidiicola]|uniref:Uncharacterized protein n=1 Tax=Ophidiomyces ophidiicola TaxID=1387563 RepID=A0ACB8UZJ8_9EURO|nr:uncharacterized protein LOZ57_002933 [Ophidiomyces ophidiicola]KAI1911071.1 hypothetical protein LOZ61_004049 [Ophidiomyces ophidiicola]KAI1914428.1 hypothetical protein LOZ64_003843 [Ophidiomyces ophidiicola]KAI1931249.1 hypothetical protein LOZ60_000278 [Ophidiomyces ophidiicola]KAI1947782.1 hypothetical protein LOZ57_002933 [Ophidiomyces ophidiicola]KAI1948824.1 hypothetical protein LOZ62_002504 [Ophidiomyces ophidiicola]